MTGTAAPRRARAVFLGSGPFAVPVLDRLAEADAVTLVGVVSAPARPAGRRGELTETPVARAAAERGLEPVLTPARLRDPAAISAVLDLGPDLLVLADYGRLVPPALLDLPHGALNLHPSLLPRHRGASPIPATLLAGDPVTGVTLMRMDEGLDTGPTLAAEHLPLRGDEDALSLEARLATLGADLLDRSLGPWLDGTLPAVAQPAEGASLTRPLRREDGRLDARRPAADLERQVRAYRPWPGSFLEANGTRLVIHRADTAPSRPGDRPGELVPHDEGIALATGDGRLVLHEVQPAGGRPMSGAAWVRGRRDPGRA